jgi:pimeloyl-ACP methyl ester carboxylesterase
MTQPIIVFSHGQDGEPWGTKIVAMAAIAREAGYQVESVDYRGMADPAARVEKLHLFCQSLAKTANIAPVLVGSSLGGHVATAVSKSANARGLFLLAPAFYMTGYEQYTPQPAMCPITIVHGWNDDIVPVDNSIRYAREHHARLHVIDSDHRMTMDIDDITQYLAQFLMQLNRDNERGDRQ